MITQQDSLSTWNPSVIGSTSGGTLPTHGLVWVDPWQWPRTPWQIVTAAPTVCAGDVHVFPCPHCRRCRCGKAALSE